MKNLIDELFDMIEEEVCDAEKYAHCAIHKKEEFPKIAEVFNRLSMEEINHATSLQEQANGLILQGADEITDDCRAIYGYRTQKAKTKISEIKIMQALYKGA